MSGSTFTVFMLPARLGFTDSHDQDRFIYDVYSKKALQQKDRLVGSKAACSLWKQISRQHFEIILKNLWKSVKINKIERIIKNEPLEKEGQYSI